MGPKRLAQKRRSDSPLAERDAVEPKKYRTRASNKSKAVSYEDARSSEDEQLKKTKENQDLDFEGDQIIEVSRSKKKISSTYQHKSVPKLVKASVPSSSIISVFKPVCVDTMKIKTELDLSDSDSDDSTACVKASLSLNESNLSMALEQADYVKEKNVHVKKEEQMSNDDTLLQSGSGVVDIWVKNLEALKYHECYTDEPSNSSCKNEINFLSEGTLTHVKNTSSKRKSNKQKPLHNLDVSELLKCERSSDDRISDGDDENWEKVTTESPSKITEERKLPEKVEVMIDVGDVKKKRKELDIQNIIRLKLNRIRREIQLDLHQASLVGLLAHGYLINQMLNDPEIAASALSVVPQSGFPPTRTDLSYLEKLVNWIQKHFKLKTSKDYNGSSFPTKTDILKCLSSSEPQSKKELVYTSVAICRALGISARLVWSLQPLSSKVDPNELQPLNNGKGTNRKKDRNSETEKTIVKSEPKSQTKTEKGAKSTAKNKKSAQGDNAESKPSNSKGKKSKYFESEKQPVKEIVHSNKKQDTKTTVEKKPSTSIASKGKDVKGGQKKSEEGQLTGSKDVRAHRSRRTSAEKPVKYHESTAESSDDEPKKTTKSTSNKKKTSSTKQISKKGSKSRRAKPDSSDEFEAPNEEDSEDNSQSKVKSKSHVASGKKIISTDSEPDTSLGVKDEQREKKNGSNVWLEVYLEHEEQWMSVDVIGAKVHCDRHMERNASTPLLYVVAFNPDLTWKDVTARYASSFLSVTRKQRAHPGWSKLLSINLEKSTAKSKAEDELLEKSLTERPMPTSISEFKSHPLYALQRHLLKFEAIYPPSAIPVGYIRGEPVYARECVKCLHSRDTWLKEAKVVRIGEKPYKIVKARPKWDRHLQKMVSDLPLELFGDWQVEEYIPPPAVDGVVPRNAYGNVELFKASMLPKGTKHLQIPGLNKVARRLGIDCAPAMTGWEARGGYSCPVYDGYVVCEEHVETLLDAWETANAEQEQREKEKREKRVYGNWRRLIRGLLIKERLHAKYFSKLMEEDPEKNPEAEPIKEKPALSAKTNAKKKK